MEMIQPVFQRIKLQYAENKETYGSVCIVLYLYCLIPKSDILDVQILHNFDQSCAIFSYFSIV